LIIVPLIVSWDVIEVPAILLPAIWLVLQLIAGAIGPQAMMSPHAGAMPLWPHLAGFVTGVTGVFLLRKRERERVEWWSV
jgi:membrane associated rhomboid family serine protease